MNEQDAEELRKHLEAKGERAREAALIRKYGIDAEDYSRMLASQNGKCLICGSIGSVRWNPRAGDYQTQRLVVDHDHKTGKVRGLLCHGCNGLLGEIEARPGRPNAPVVSIGQGEPPCVDPTLTGEDRIRAVCRASWREHLADRVVLYLEGKLA